jgi:hypothetical protein
MLKEWEKVWMTGLGLTLASYKYMIVTGLPDPQEMTLFTLPPCYERLVLNYLKVYQHPFHYYFAT